MTFMKRGNKIFPISFAIWFGALIVVLTFYQVCSVREEKEEAATIAGQINEIIQYRIDDFKRNAEVLRAWLNAMGDDVKREIESDEDGEVWLEEFNIMAASIYDEELMYSVQMIPSGIVRYLYPMSEDSPFFGKDIFEDEREQNVIEEAEESKLVVASGPIYVSGVGMCLDLYTPVYYDDGTFWGFTAIVIRLPEAFKELALNRLNELGYNYRLSYDSGDGTEEWVAGTLSSGATISSEFIIQDTTWYLMVEPVDGWIHIPSLLGVIAAITVGAFMLSLLTSFIKLNRDEKLAHLSRDAVHDRMTGLLNHVRCVEEIRRELEIERGGVLFIIDIDNFKSVNDTAGHLAGDQILLEVARAMRTTFRRGDILGRYGGDEFLVYMIGDMTIPDFSLKASQFQRKIRKIFVGETDRSITCSMGVARRCTDTTTPEVLIKRADKALYDSKKQGKDRFTIFDDSSSVPVKTPAVEEDQRNKKKVHDFINRE